MLTELWLIGRCVDEVWCSTFVFYCSALGINIRRNDFRLILHPSEHPIFTIKLFQHSLNNLSTSSSIKMAGIIVVKRGVTPVPPCTVQRGVTPVPPCTVQRGVTPVPPCTVQRQRGVTPVPPCTVQRML